MKQIQKFKTLFVTTREGMNFM